MAITGGSITYGRTVNLGDYNSKRADATFAFDDPADVANAAVHAQSVVANLLGGNVAGVVVPATEPVKERKPRAKKVDAAEVTETVTDADLNKEAFAGVKAKDPSEVVESFDAPVVAEISNDDLLSACNRAVAKVGADGPTKVRALKAKYVADLTKSVITLPQSIRAKFLEELAALA